METIKSYIESLFQNYPDTQQVRKAKEELLGIMEDKYNECKAEGKSEHEAIGLVISEFGSIDEMASELGWDNHITIEKKEESQCSTEKMLTKSQAEEYLKRRTEFGLKIAAGVAICILSPVISCVAEAMQEMNLLPAPFAEFVGGASVFLMIAIAVGIFITAGIANGRFEDYKECGVRLSPSTKEPIKARYETFMQAFGLKIAAGVILCILSVVPPMFVSSFFGESRFYGLEQMSGICLFVFVAMGVFLFITEGIKKDAYEVLLSAGEYVPKKAVQKKGDRLTELIAAVYWPLVLVVYLIWSITSGSWGFTWIVWPIAGILFGAVSAAISIICRGE